jgi:hypothetical protein
MTASDLADFEKFVLLCKKHGVLSARCDGVEVTLAPEAAAGPVPREMRELAEALAEGTATDHDMLFHSAPRGVTPEQVEAYRKQLLGG